MDLNSLKQRAIAIPFLPFVVVLKDGRQFPVVRRYQFAVSPIGTYFVVEDERGMQRIDTALIDTVQEFKTTKVSI